MRTELVIEASAHRSPRIRSWGGLSGRITGPDTVHMIGTAATPLGGDEILVRVLVAADSTLAVHSVAASVALPSATSRDSCARWILEVEDGGHLVFDPEPLIVAADAVHHTRTHISFSSSSTIEFRERVQIGRSGESAGRWLATTHSDVDGRPHLRHRVELGVGSAGHDALDAPMALSSTLRYPDERGAGFAGHRGVRMPLAAGGTLTTCTGAKVDELPLSV